MASRKKNGWGGGEVTGCVCVFFFKPFDKLTRLWIFSLGGRRWNNHRADLCVKRICWFSSFLWRLVGGETGGRVRPIKQAVNRVINKERSCNQTQPLSKVKVPPRLQHTLFFFFDFLSFFLILCSKKLTSCSLLSLSVTEGQKEFNHNFIGSNKRSRFYQTAWNKMQLRCFPGGFHRCFLMGGGVDKSDVQWRWRENCVWCHF